MRTTLPALGFLVFICGAGRANDVAAVAVVENAVRAMANSDLRLNRLASVIRKESGTLSLPTGPAAVQRTVYLNPPERLKYEAVVDLAGQKQAMVLALNGVNGWQKAGPGIKDLTAAEYDVMQDEAYAWWLTTLLPLRQKDVALKPAPPGTVGGKPAVGVIVSRSNRSEARVYFDAATGLPVQVKVKVREAGVEVARDYDLGEHKDFDTLKLPTKITVFQNGKKIEEWTVESYRTPDRLDSQLFAKPK